MIFKKLLKGEILEFDLISLQKKEGINYIYILWVRIYHLIYKNIQRMFLQPKLRNILKKIELFLFKKNFNEKISLNSNLESFKKRLVKDNFTEFDNLLSNDEINILNNNFKNEFNLIDVYTDNKDFSYFKKPDNAKMGYVPTEKIFENEIVIKTANNENLINLLKSYFNCNFSLDWAWAWWSFKNHEENHGPQNFHRDYESLNFVKVFIYLTDVTDEKHGCHEFILGSAQKNMFYKRERFNEKDIKSEFKDNIKKIYGHKGKTFIVDTYGIHRGLRPVTDDRLVMVLMYSVFPTNRSPKIPPIYLSNLKNKDLYLKNKYINRLFINFDR